MTTVAAIGNLNSSGLKSPILSCGSGDVCISYGSAARPQHRPVLAEEPYTRRHYDDDRHRY